jgi:hypothetical protein
MKFRFERWWREALIAAAAGTMWHASADEITTHGATNAAGSGGPTAASLVDQATRDEEDGKLEAAESEASEALGLDPKNLSALELRGSIYLEEKFWDRAVRDYTTLNEMNPDPTYRYKLAEIKYLQKDFSNARVLFAALEGDSRLGDLAKYKVFLCDLLGGHEGIAARDLGTLDQTGEQPSFYFGPAAWALYHQQRATANKLLAQANGHLSNTIFGLYYASLTEVQRFQTETVSFTTKDGKRYVDCKAFLESSGLRLSTRSGWVTLPLDQLPDDLSIFPVEMREEIAHRREAAARSSSPTETARLSFTTKSGQTYRQARWRLGDAGIEVLTPDGWIFVSVEDLPDDRASFPPELQKQIGEMRKGTAPAATSNVVSFTTKRGKLYQNARAALEDDGIRALTPDGWIRVPFADLPDDLSPFPAAWQAEIRARLKSGDEETMASVVSFTTRGGTAYQEARAALDSDGVRVLTPEGWRTVAFADLPADLAAFPAGWRGKIEDGLKGGGDEGPRVRVVSFTTKRGKSYAQVRAEMAEDGVRVLTEDGWTVVTFDQLPADLSAFPEAWRATIASKQKEAAAAVKP